MGDQPSELEGAMTHFAGYAGNILRVNLSTGDVNKVPTAYYEDLFLGGRGIAAKVYWDEVPPGIKAFDAENRLIFITGPVGGVPGFAGSRWQVCGKSPINNQFSYCNLGGSWGAELKFAGYDGLVVYGKADKPVYLWVDDDRVEIREAAHLVSRGAIYSRQKIKEELGKSVRVVAVGSAGDNMVTFATVLADNDATGSGGLGAVMGSKNLKAIAVRGSSRKVEVADPERARKLREWLRREAKDRPGLYSTVIPAVVDPDRLKKDVCYGCISGCMRANYTAMSGVTGKFMCQAGLLYQARAQRYYGELNEVPFEANKLCDEYGVDTRAVETMIMWLSRCYQAKLLTDEQTGIPLSKLGSREFIETFLWKVAHRDGFGDLLAEGTHKAAETLGIKGQALLTDYITSTGSNAIYGPRLYITTGLFYATEPRLPIQQLHEISALAMFWALGAMGMDNIYVTSDVMRAIGKRFWGSEIAADFSTYEGKALAAAKIQDRQYAKECLILCDFYWPIIHSAPSEDHVGDPTLESQVCAAVTGREVDEKGLYEIGERVLNLQRAILAREGHQGREYDSLEEFNFTIPLKGDYGNPNCIVPGKDGEVFSRKGMVVERDQFEKMKDEYYQIRGWDVATGFQRKARLEKLNLGEVANKLESAGLLA
jgi:aldehyde:ferredoxin oxidoreductase